MRRALKVGCFAALAVLAAPAAWGVFAQELTDRIVALVDRNPIFASDVDAALVEEIYVRRLRGETPPADSAGLAALREEVLEGIIDRRVVIAKAEKESVAVTATEVEDGLDQWLDQLVKASGSEAAFNQELARQGFTLVDLKDRYRKEIENQLLVSKFMRQQFGAIAVSEKDIAHFFEAKYDSIPSLPEVVGIAHIIVAPRISPERETAVGDRVSRILGRLKRGEAFEKVASETSDDLATRAAGGDIGRVALADIEPGIASAAAGLAVGQVSEPFRTGPGIEILKLEDKAGGVLKLRHIFVGFAPDAADTAEAAGRAEAIRARLAAGESFESLAREYSQDETTRESGGYLGEVETSALDATYSQAIAALNPGEISPLIKTARGFQIIKLISRTAARKPSYEEAKPWIRNLIESRKREEQFAAWLTAARQEIYIKKLQ